jgi:PAS domain-containing protein
VMDMLDMGRRRARVSEPMRAESMRESTVREAFERSRLPQALICIDGTITTANKAFAKLVGLDNPEGEVIAQTALGSLIPGLMRALRAVHMDGKATERTARIERAGQSPLELTLWIFPLPMSGQEIHVFAKIDDAKT